MNEEAELQALLNKPKCAIAGCVHPDIDSHGCFINVPNVGPTVHVLFCVPHHEAVFSNFTTEYDDPIEFREPRGGRR